MGTYAALGVAGALFSFLLSLSITLVYLSFRFATSTDEWCMIALRRWLPDYECSKLL